MPNRPTETDVILKLDGSISPTQFQRAVKDFFGLVREVSKAVGPEDGLEWEVFVREGSSVVGVSGRPVGIAPYDDVYRTVDVLDQGIKSLGSGASDRPSGFNDKALDFVHDLAVMAENARENGLDSVTVRANGVAIPMSAKVLVSIDNIRGPVYRSYGSIEGRLRSVADKSSSFKIGIADSLTDKVVDCTFADEAILESALAAFRCRVVVRGEIRRRQDGQPMSVKVDELSVMRDTNELRSPQSIYGIFSKMT